MDEADSRATGIDLLTFAGRRKFRALSRTISRKHLDAEAALVLAVTHVVSDEDGNFNDAQVRAALTDTATKVPNTDAMRSVAWHSALRHEAYDILMLLASYADPVTGHVLLNVSPERIASQLPLMTGLTKRRFFKAWQEIVESGELECHHGKVYLALPEAPRTAK